MIKFTCYIDTSSYINLSKSEYKSGSFLDILYNKTNIKFCPFINNTEIPNHYNNNMPKSLKRSSQVYYYSKLDYNREHDLLFPDSSSDNDRGEKENLMCLFDYYLDKKKKGLVFLTDDRKAVNGQLSNLISAFPLFKVWSSFDVILFLLIEKEITKEIAQSAIQDLNAIMATDDEKMDPKKTQLRIQIRATYEKRIKLLNQLIHN